MAFSCCLPNEEADALASDLIAYRRISLTYNPRFTTQHWRREA